MSIRKTEKYCSSAHDKKTSIFSAFVNLTLHISSTGLEKRGWRIFTVTVGIWYTRGRPSLSAQTKYTSSLLTLDSIFPVLVPLKEGKSREKRKRESKREIQGWGCYAWSGREAWQLWPPTRYHCPCPMKPRGVIFPPTQPHFIEHVCMFLHIYMN